MIFPTTAAESHGIEDARLVRFVDEDGSVTLLRHLHRLRRLEHRAPPAETDDFETFSHAAAVGPAAKNKGMALFPRRIGGRFWRLSRWDRENISVARSDGRLRWGARRRAAPEPAWELIQLGSCGSPLETPEGWLVITHGVGPMRTYALGAMLLDLDDPSIVLAA